MGLRPVPDISCHLSMHTPLNTGLCVHVSAVPGLWSWAPLGIAHAGSLVVFSQHFVISSAVFGSMFCCINLRYLKVPDQLLGKYSCLQSKLSFQSTVASNCVFLRGSVEVCFGAKGKRVVVLVSEIVEKEGDPIYTLYTSEKV